MGGASLDSVGVSDFANEQIIIPKINTENNEEEPTTELGLALVCANQCTLGGLNNDLGAGANAGSRTDMMFATTNHLSELVWSPHKGLSLKCADCSLAEEKPSLLWGVGSSNMVLSPPQSITAKGTRTDGPVVEGNLSSSEMPTHFEGSRGEAKILNTTVEVLVQDINHGTYHSNKREKHIYGPNNIKTTDVPRTRGNIVLSSPKKDVISEGLQFFSCFTFYRKSHGSAGLSAGPDNRRATSFLSLKFDEPKSVLAQAESRCGDLNKGRGSDPFDRSRDDGSGNNHATGMAVVLASKVSKIKECKSPNTPLPNMAPPEGVTAVIEEDRNNKIDIPRCAYVPLEKRESTSENDLQTLKGKSALAEAGIIVAPQPSYEGMRSPQQNDGIDTESKAVPVEEVLLYQRKGKEKALSDGEVNGSTSKKDDDSNESVESCNSAGLLPTGKRRWSFEQTLVIGNKKMKKQIHENPSSASFFRQDSSFMKWISNMVKGLPKSNQDETPLALTVSPHHGHGIHDQNFMSHGNKQDPENRNLGFQTVFQALYRPNTTAKDRGTWNPDHQMEGSKELEMANKSCDDSSTPITRGEENDKFCKQTYISSDNSNQDTPIESEGLSAQPNISSANISVVQANHRTNTAENNNPCNIACGPQKVGVSLSDSSFQNDPKYPSGGTKVYKLGFTDPNKPSTAVTNRSTPLESLWLTRFSRKDSGLVLSSPQCRQSTDGVIEGFTDCARLPTHSQNYLISLKDQKDFKDSGEPSSEDQMDAVSKKLQNSAAITTFSYGLERTDGHTAQKFKSKLSHIQPSQRFKSSEAIATIFARRLDALRHIIASEAAVDNATHSTTTCLFCGERGHNLQNCSAIIESELEDLLKNINSYEGAKEFSCFCICCFQLNHWANVCPKASSKRQSHSDGIASLVNHSNFGKLQCHPGNDTLMGNDERNLQPLEDKNCQYQVTSAVKACNVKVPRGDTKHLVHTNLNHKLSGKILLHQKFSDLYPVKKKIVSSSREIGLKENQITPFCNFANEQIPAIRRRAFEGMRRLRLSRTDFLKWLKSPISHSSLEGFFLRLRLGKWEERLGGTEYYVACINGALRERSLGSSKPHLSVSIGDFKCFVESRYISNQDFTEDELMAWWCAISNRGGKLPTDEELNAKLEERKKFGF